MYVLDDLCNTRELCRVFMSCENSQQSRISTGWTAHVRSPVFCLRHNSQSVSAAHAVYGQLLPGVKWSEPKAQHSPPSTAGVWNCKMAVNVVDLAKT